MTRFLLKRKPSERDTPWPEPTGSETILTQRPAPPKLASKEEEKEASSSKASTRKVHECHAFLGAFQRERSETVSSHGTSRYVIIGRGPAAMTNLATLRAMRNSPRLAGREIVVVGQDDPWNRYVDHDMNQEVELLTLPGFQHQPVLPGPGAAPRWLSSKTFALTNSAELESAAAADQESWPPVTQISAGVVKIDLVSEEPEVYQIEFDGGHPPLLASHVDVCTGTGQQTYVEASGDYGVEMCAALWEEYFTPPHPETNPHPRICSAEMFVVGQSQVIPGASVLVAPASSPAGLQAGEHALSLDRGDGGAAAEVLLIASRTMNEGFLPIGRLDHLARTVDMALPVRLHHPIGDKLYPTDERMWFGEYYRVKRIEVFTEFHRRLFSHSDDAEISQAAVGSKLLVTFRVVGGRGNQAGSTVRLVQGTPIDKEVDPSLVSEKLLVGLFDQVVISTGRARGGARVPSEEPGSAMQLVWSLKDSLQQITVPGYDFAVGLQSPSGQLRILGAAGLNNPIYKLNARNLKAFEDSLPWQARVNGEGITLAAVTIAIANGYFCSESGKRNGCVNTATRDELKGYFGDQFGEQIFWARHSRVRPFQSVQELFRVLMYESNLEDLNRLGLIELLNNYEKLLDPDRLQKFYAHPRLWPGYAKIVKSKKFWEGGRRKMPMTYRVPKRYAAK